MNAPLVFLRIDACNSPFCRRKKDSSSPHTWVHVRKIEGFLMYILSSDFVVVPLFSGGKISRYWKKKKNNTSLLLQNSFEQKMNPLQPRISHPPVPPILSSICSSILSGQKTPAPFPTCRTTYEYQPVFFFGWTFKRLEKRWVLFFFQVSSSDLSEVGIFFFESSLLREESAVPKRLSVR